MVYVVQEPTDKNIMSAKAFGPIQILLPPGQVAYSPGPTVYRLKQKLKNFCNDDYLLLIGDPVAIALAAEVAATMNVGKVKFLKWDRQERRYMAVVTDINRKLSES